MINEKIANPVIGGPIDEDTRISLLQYSNLRKHFTILLRHILGKDYYNLGDDVYACDKLCCDDIWREFVSLKMDYKFFYKCTRISVGFNILFGLFIILMFLIS